MFMAVTGISEKMVRHYTARANQFRLASKAQLKREKQNVPKTECSNIGSCTVQTPVAEARKATRNRLLASWRSGDAADCKSVYTGSIPVLASKFFLKIQQDACKLAKARSPYKLLHTAIHTASIHKPMCSGGPASARWIMGYAQKIMQTITSRPLITRPLRCPAMPSGNLSARQTRTSADLCAGFRRRPYRG